MAVMPDLFRGRGPRPICVAHTIIDASRGKVNEDIDAARVWLVAQDTEAPGDASARYFVELRPRACPDALPTWQRNTASRRRR
jgi:hypothetical protein